jgi:hypothetical protein
VLNAIYEGDFVGFSYGFRPGRGPHDALDALSTAIKIRKVNWILDADIQNFFGSVSQDWLGRFLEHRIGDKRIIRLIQKWLRAGILEDGAVTVSDRGTGQGSVASPLLANIYLHYVLDLWAERWRRHEATGDMIIVRYADDLVAGFEHEDDARRFLDAMRTRFEEFALSLHPDKTRLIEFGRHAAANREKNGLGKPETFNFLGFTLLCGKSRRLLWLSCSADQLPGTGGLPAPCRPTLAAHASAAQPKGWHRMGTDREAGARLPPQTPHPSPLAQRALRRQTPEVGAVCGKVARTDLCGGRPVMDVPCTLRLDRRATISR